MGEFALTSQSVGGLSSEARSTCHIRFTRCATRDNSWMCWQLCHQRFSSRAGTSELQSKTPNPPNFERLWGVVFLFVFKTKIKLKPLRGPENEDFSAHMILAIFCALLTLHITNASGALDPGCCEPWADWTHWTEVTPCRQGSSQTSLGLLGFMFKEEKCCLSNKNKNCQRHMAQHSVRYYVAGIALPQDLIRGSSLISLG